jgi:hypothetical protein
MSKPSWAAVVVEVTGEPGGRWSIERCAGGWQQVSDPSPIVRATVKLDPLTTWKLVTKRHDRGTVRSQFPTIEIVGDKQLGSHVLDMVSMMAWVRGAALLPNSGGIRPAQARPVRMR